jgi:hypothetical protein
MTPPAPSTGPAGRPGRHARATGWSPSGTGPPRAGAARPLKALLFIYIFIFAVGVIGSILSSAAVHKGFYIVACVAGLLAFTRINSIIFLERTSGSSSGRGFRGSSGIAGPEPDGLARDEVPGVISLRARAGWRIMRAAAWLMPRAAGSRWLAEAGSFLSEAPPALRGRALRSYLAAAPPAILVSWACHLARRTRAR